MPRRLPLHVCDGDTSSSRPNSIYACPPLRLHASSHHMPMPCIMALYWHEDHGLDPPTIDGGNLIALGEYALHTSYKTSIQPPLMINCNLGTPNFCRNGVCCMKWCHCNIDGVKGSPPRSQFGVLLFKTQWLQWVTSFLIFLFKPPINHRFWLIVTYLFAASLGLWRIGVFSMNWW